MSDHLRTASVITDSAGNIKSESDYYPWGGELQFTNNDSNHYKFTGKERDSETGLDYFGARHYSNSLGRFLTADWNSKPVAVPYVDLGDPQSLNLYSYVRNRPTVLADQDGHSGDCPSGASACSVSTGARSYVSSSDDKVTVTTYQSRTVQYTDEHGNQVRQTTTKVTASFYSRDSGKEGQFLGAVQRSLGTLQSTTDPVKANSGTAAINSGVIYKDLGGATDWQKTTMSAADAAKVMGPGAASEMIDATRPSLTWGAMKSAMQHPWETLERAAAGGLMALCFVGEPCGAIEAGLSLVVGGAALGGSMGHDSH